MAKLKVLTVVGTRPQYIKAAAVSRALRPLHDELLVDTGQHYDANMSEVFLRELEMPRPDRNLGVGSGSHGEQTARMMLALEPLVQSEAPDVMLVYGDTNSTLAGALVAAKLHVRLAHVEAGLRSFDRRMPEEVNRVVADHLSRWLFAPTPTAVANLEAEGIRVGHVTDLGYMTELVMHRLKCCDVIVLESNHDLEMLKVGPYPWHLKQRIMSRQGHLSNEIVGRFLEDEFDGKAQYIILAHLSENNNHPDIARMVAAQSLEPRGFDLGNLQVASKSSPSPLIHL